MSNKPKLYKFSDIEHRLHSLEPGQTYIKPFVTSKVSDTMCGGLNFLNKISVPWDLTCDEIIYCMKKRDPSIHFAGKFSAKEAIRKAISSSYFDILLPLNEINIKNDKKGRPFLENSTIDSKFINISISHTNDYAISFAILMLDDKYS